MLKHRKSTQSHPTRSDGIAKTGQAHPFNLDDDRHEEVYTMVHESMDHNYSPLDIDEDHRRALAKSLWN